MKRSIRSLIQFRSFWPSALAVLVIWAAILAATLTLHILKDIPIDKLTRDPLQVMDQSVCIGFVSQLGIFIWAGTAAICLFAAYVLINRSGNAYLKNFLLASGCLSLFLGLDDVFLLHEKVLPLLGVMEKVVYILYACIILVWLATFFSDILTTEFVLLCLSLLFFGITVLMDVIAPQVDIFFFYEDGAKLLGMMFWLAYFIRVAALSIGRRTV